MRSSEQEKAHKLNVCCQEWRVYSTLHIPDRPSPNVCIGQVLAVDPRKQGSLSFSGGHERGLLSDQKDDMRTQIPKRFFLLKEVTFFYA